MAEQAELEQDMLQQMQQLEQMQQRYKEMKKRNKLYEYNGPQIQIKLQISDKTFISSTKVLCNKANGNNLFIRHILGINDDEGDDSKNDVIISQVKPQKNAGCIELFFDRDPDVFPIILKYLRGYNMRFVLYECCVTKLQCLLDDAVYYKMKGLIDLINDCIHKRFDPIFCSPLISLSLNGTVATRMATNGGLHHICGVYGVLRKGKRYVEFQIISQGNRYIMLGVTQADNYSSARYPGHAKCAGCAYYAANGNLYRSGSNEAWGAALNYGDKCGILVEISNDQNIATIAWYINGKLVKQPINLKEYMDFGKGVVFAATLYADSEKVVIVQSPTIPQ